MGEQLVSELTIGKGDLLDYEFPFELSEKAKSNLKDLHTAKVCIVDDELHATQLEV